MISFTRNAQAMEASNLLFAPHRIEQMWTFWQNAWGAVRIFVKMTTQCKVHVPEQWNRGKTKKEKRSTFMQPAYEHIWGYCEKAAPFEPSEFPSTTVACAREDE